MYLTISIGIDTEEGGGDILTSMIVLSLPMKMETAFSSMLCCVVIDRYVENEDSMVQYDDIDTDPLNFFQ